MAYLRTGDDMADWPLILVVEDEPAVRCFAVKGGRIPAVSALEAQHSAEAPELLERHPEIALFLTDVRMPGGMNGAELAFTVRTRWPL